MRFLVVAPLVAGCGFQLGGSAVDAGPLPDGTPDQMIDTPPDVPFDGFGTPMLVEVSSSSLDDDVTLTADMLEMYFESDRMGGDGDIFVSTRPDLTTPWSMPERVGELSTMWRETSMEVAPDGLSILFSSNRPTSMDLDVWFSFRATRSALWAAPVRIASLSSSGGDYNAQLFSPMVVYLDSDRSGAQDFDIYRATRTGTTGPFAVTLIGSLSMPGYQGEAFVDATERMWFTMIVGDDEDIYYADPAGGGAYGKPTKVTELSTTNQENDPWISPDGKTIFFTSDRAGTLDIYYATRP